jgi:hypothetical protein
MLVSKGAPAAAVHAMGAPVQRAPQASGDIRTAAICINDLDRYEWVVELAQTLRRFDLRISIRLHDADPRLEKFRELARTLGATFSSARESKIAAYLAGVDLVIVGNSNVVADALRAGRPVLYYWPGRPDLFDYYGFVRYYQLPHARDAATLDTALRAILGR